jgi:hypothetical protein
VLHERPHKSASSLKLLQSFLNRTSSFLVSGGEYGGFEDTGSERNIAMENGNGRGRALLYEVFVGKMPIRQSGGSVSSQAGSLNGNTSASSACPP